MAIELRALERGDLGAARALLEEACAFDRAAAVAAEKLFGRAPGALRVDAWGAFADGAAVGVMAASGRWIRLLAVAPGARGRGIGTLLLAAGEEGVAAAGEARARTMDQPGNYLAPGIDARNTETVAWLERRDYERVGENTNLVVALAGNDRVSRARAETLAARAAGAGYTCRRAGAGDAAALAAMVAASFGAGWAFEVERALGGDPPGVHVAFAADGSPAAFAAHDGNNRGLGWFGPAGTVEEHRGRGLGEALLVACLADVAEAGHARCEIAWIGPRRFYEKSVGVAGERRFVVLAKELSN